MFKIKICGITTPEDALLAADAGADAIGLNFYEKSPRYITLEQANELAAALPVQTRAVGVFVNAPIERIIHYQQHVGLDIIQLHGSELPETIYKLRGAPFFKVNRLISDGYSCSAVEVIRAFRCRNASLNDVAQFLDEYTRINPRPKDEWYPYVMLDAFSPTAFGGTGAPLDWSRLAIERHLVGGEFILAGGLTPENVAEAILTAHPNAVDVASGVESSPGRKDPAKVRDFVAAAKEAFVCLERENPK
jgi:phosphoribosylanthranilate isomerase